MNTEKLLAAAREDLLLAANTSTDVLRFIEKDLSLTPRQAMITLAISYIAVCDMIGLEDEQTMQLIKAIVAMSQPIQMPTTTH